MKVQIQGKQMRLSRALKSYAYDRLIEPLTHFYDRPAAELRIELGDNNGPKGGNDRECHLTLRMPGRSTLQVEVSTPDSYSSIDAASERLIRACKRELTRMRQPKGLRRARAGQGRGNLSS
jgi:ribosome-associated translation inhibitor RaiA